MPWKAQTVYELRLAMVHRIIQSKRPVAEVAREFGVSRKTAHKWLARHRGKEPGGLWDRSHRPARSPAKAADALEQAVVEERHRHNWGPRKIHRVLADRGVAGLPSARTLANILARRGCVGVEPQPPPAPPPQAFERPEPNQLWQVDHKGPLEVARQTVWPLAVLDDHSRYLLCFRALPDRTMASAWAVLWELFGAVGLPQSVLCDRAFGKAGDDAGLSWFDARLVRLGIDPSHGRPHHPQTQGKVERLNGTAERELIGFAARRDSVAHFDQDADSWRTTYNTVRPHEALGDLPPVVRWRPATDRPRPAQLPAVSYAADAITRRVSHAGDFRYRNARVLVGRGLAGERVRVEQREHDTAVYYAWKRVRVIANDLLAGPRSDKMV